MRMLSMLCDSSTEARRGNAGIRMASHTSAAANAFTATRKGKQPPIADWSRRRCLPSSEHVDGASLLHDVPKSEPKVNVRSKFTVLECLAQLLGKASIDLPAARSAL